RRRARGVLEHRHPHRGRRGGDRGRLRADHARRAGEGRRDRADHAGLTLADNRRMSASNDSSLTVLCLTMNPSVDLATETEQVVPTHKLRCGDTLHDAGGGGINVARVLTQLGGACTSLCPAGGPSGHWLRTRMQQEGLVATYLLIGQETRVSFTVHEHSTGAEYRFVMPGPRLAEAEWQAALQHLERLASFP